MSSGSVSITIVTYNSAQFIRRCLEHVFGQDYPAIEIIIVDNASFDDTPRILKDYEQRVRVIYNSENRGFAGGQNQAIRLADGDWVLTLNPDVRLTRSFVSHVVTAGEIDNQIGSVSGKLLSMSTEFAIPTRPVIDSTGIYITPSLRHFDRGSRLPDTGAYDSPEYVFGVTGAAALYRRRMIEDVSISGELFDEDFFVYREDADLAWRAQLLGWKCLYTPNAVAYHVRSVLPSNRASVPAVVNMHAVKNRFLMRIKNITGRLYLRHFVAITVRDAIVFAACLVREHSSLPAFAFVMRNLPRTWAKRREILSRRVATNAYLEAWFSNKPVGFSAPEIPARVTARG